MGGRSPGLFLDLDRQRVIRSRMSREKPSSSASALDLLPGREDRGTGSAGIAFTKWSSGGCWARSASGAGRPRTAAGGQARQPGACAHAGSAQARARDSSAPGAARRGSRAAAGTGAAPGARRTAASSARSELAVAHTRRLKVRPSILGHLARAAWIDARAGTWEEAPRARSPRSGPASAPCQ